jgi:hypothetical protein
VSVLNLPPQERALLQRMIRHNQTGYDDIIGIISRLGQQAAMMSVKQDAVGRDWLAGYAAAMVNLHETLLHEKQQMGSGGIVP